MTDDRIRWGVLGCAGIAQLTVPAIGQSSTGRLYAIASRRMERAEEWRQRYGFEKVYNSYEALLADPEVDAVYIPLPNSLHAQWAIAAAEAGKHILVEKPAAMSVREGEEMVAAARRAGVLLLENFAFRHHPHHLKVRELLAKGTIGDVWGLQGFFNYVVPMEKGQTPLDIRLVPELGGGVSRDLACYMIAFSRSVFGAEPVSVLAYGDLHPDFGVDVVFNGVLDFGEGRTATFATSFLTPGWSEAVIWGTEGEMVLRSPCHPRREEDRIIVRRQVFDKPGSPKDEDEIIETPVVEPFTAIVDAMGAHLREGTPLAVGPEDALANLRVLDACLQSAREGRRIRLASQ